MRFFLFSPSMKPHLPEHMGWKIELKGQPASMLPGFFCHKAQRTFILGIRFAEDGLALRIIHKTAYRHQGRFAILKDIPVAAAYARQKVFHFIDRLETHVPEMAKLQVEHRITQGLDINLIVPGNGQHFGFLRELLWDGWLGNILF